jgi:hypothetical protein
MRRILPIHDYSQPLLFFAKTLVFVLLSLFSFFFIYCVSRRILYPFELEWLEGEILCHVVRLLDGKSIYAPPSTEFISEVYPPFYYIITAALCKIFDVSFFVPRLISVASCLGILFFLYRIILQEGGQRSIGLLCCGFFVSFYQIHGTWYDLGRVDMLLFFLIIAGCFLLAYYRNRSWALACSAVLFVLACYTKQSALCFIPFVVLYLLGIDKKKAVIFLCSVCVLFIIVFYVLNAATDGWFATYTYLNPLRYSNNQVKNPLLEMHYAFAADVERKLLYEMRYEIFYKLPVFFTLVMAFLIKRAVSLKRPFNLTVWEFTAIPAAVSYFMLRPHIGSEKNDLIYITLWGCILLGLFLIKLSASQGSRNKSSTLVTVYILLALQLVLQIYNPKNQVPSSESVSKGNEFIALVKNMPGQVFIPYHSMYGVMAGKKMFINSGAYWGYLVTSGKPLKITDLIEKINHKYFSAIILDDKSYYTLLGQNFEFDIVAMLFSSEEYLSKAIKANYKLQSRIPYRSDSEFRNLAGFMTRPELIYVPRDS